MSLQSDRLDEFHSCTAEHPPSLNSTMNSTAVANIDILRDAANYISKIFTLLMSAYSVFKKQIEIFIVFNSEISYCRICVLSLATN